MNTRTRRHFVFPSSLGLRGWRAAEGSVPGTIFVTACVTSPTDVRKISDSRSRWSPCNHVLWSRRDTGLWEICPSVPLPQADAPASPAHAHHLPPQILPPPPVSCFLDLFINPLSLLVVPTWCVCTRWLKEEEPTKVTGITRDWRRQEKRSTSDAAFEFYFNGFRKKYKLMKLTFTKRMKPLATYFVAQTFDWIEWFL